MSLLTDHIDIGTSARDLDEFGPFSDFDHAANEIMASMARLTGIEHWLVTRLSGDDWVVLHAIKGGPYAAGDVLARSSDVCLHLVAGRGPLIERDATSVSSWATLPIDLQGGLKLAGAPIVVDGKTYGALCSLQTPTTSEASQAHAQMVVTAARTLSTLLAHQFAAERLVRRAERAESEALVDGLTGLYNRRGWDRLVEQETIRVQRYGNQATVFLMDVDGLKAVNDRDGHAAGDELIKRVADTLKSALREHDIAARLGGDEFGLLAVETSLIAAQVLHERINVAFAAAGVGVSIGRAHCNRPGGVVASLALADELMYLEKEHRRRL